MRRATQRRRGTIYVAVLGVAMIVSVTALTAMSVSRLQMRVGGEDCDRREARLLAQSAVEFAVNWIEETNNWRTDLTHGADSDVWTLGNGEIWFRAYDNEDVDLGDDDSDGVTLYGYGRVGDAVAVEQVTYEPEGGPLNCLEVAIHSGSGFTIPSGSFFGYHHITTNQTVSANGAIDASASYAKINGDVWASGAVAGDISGTINDNQGAIRDMPGADVFDYYDTNGTWIDITSLPESSGKRVIDEVVLSPGNNPYGDENAEGIYVIDCQGQDLWIQNSRLVATLVLKNPGPDSITAWVNHWTPAVPGYPALMVDGNFSLRHLSLWMDEGYQNVNYNPDHTPFEGESDNDQSDSYTSKIFGLVYATGMLCFNENGGAVVEGCVVCGQLDIQSNARVDYVSTSYDNPPPGFTGGGGPMAIVPASWRRAEAAP